MSIDQTWEKRYANNPNYRSWYPWSEVVSFLYRNAPRNRPWREMSVLEVGCGTGNNLWFAAREGFRTAGIEGSETAVEFARKRFAEEGLDGDFRVGDFSSLPFADRSFDFVIDRGSLTLTTRPGAIDCVREVRRVIKPNGLFQCGPFSDRDSSFYRTPDEDGLVRGIEVGTLQCGQARFYSLQDMRDLFQEGWKFEVLQHIEEADMMAPARISHCRWLAVLRAVD
jgi:ubiquinone/menaquinone biosynthesis C-methylase UbiE